MTITIGKHTFELDTWNTLSWRQLSHFCKFSIGESNPAHLKIKLLLNFCGLRLKRKRIIQLSGTDYQWFRFRGKSILLSMPVINVISERIIGIFYRRTENDEYHIDPKLSNNIIPPFRIRFKKYIGPADGLSNITFKEFIHTENFYTKYLETGDEKYLHGIVAVLFRPIRIFDAFREFLGDKRAKFNDYRIDSYIKRIEKLNLVYITAIKYFYIGCRRLLMHLFPYVFTATGSGDNSNPDTFRMYMELVDNLAGNNPTQKEAIRDQPLYEVLDSLNNIGAMDEKQKQKSKSK